MCASFVADKEICSNKRRKLQRLATPEKGTTPGTVSGVVKMVHCSEDLEEILVGGLWYPS